MSRLMSVAMTADAVIERRKTVTRPKGWWLDKNGRRLLAVGDTLTLCRKVQGRKPGEPIERLAEVEVVNVTREPLDRLLMGARNAHRPGFAATAERWAREEVEREGFPGMEPIVFVTRFFLEAQGMDDADEVTRIEWRYLDSHDPDCGVEDCGNRRCTDCGERMTCTGPEPRVCGVTCVECPCACTACDEAAQYRQDERAYEIARDER